MKFVSEHAQTQEILREWAGRDVVVAKFFFWNAGSALEKPQRGLLQGLLFQILRQHPEIIPDVLPGRWDPSKSASSSSKPWTRAELSKALEMMVSTRKLESSFCFFIDGLDGFEGDHVDLVKDLDNLVRPSVIKLCVSSRPWNAFQDAYGPFAERQFALQELNKSDMDEYIKCFLEEDERFMQLSKEDSTASTLLSLIRDRAERVFLWAKLVTKELRRGLGEYDCVAELQERLENLPTELNAFLQHILGGIEPVYRKYAARCLAL